MYLYRTCGLPLWIGVYCGGRVSIMAVNRSRAGMCQPLMARVLSKMTRPNLPAGQLFAFASSCRATVMRYWVLLGLGASIAGIADSLDSGTPAQATVPFQGCS